MPLREWRWAGPVVLVGVLDTTRRMTLALALSGCGPSEEASDMRSSSVKRMSPGMRFLFSRLFPLPFMIAGGLILYFGSRNLQRAKESSDWPTAQGVVQRSSVEYHDSDEGGGTYHAEVMYEFTVDGATFSGNCVAFGDYGSSNPSHARRIVNKYPKGTAVNVYYMRENPEVCVLEPGLKGQTWFLPAFGLVFFVIGSLMAIFLPMAMREHTTTQPGD